MSLYCCVCGQRCELKLQNGNKAVDAAPSLPLLLEAPARLSRPSVESQTKLVKPAFEETLHFPDMLYSE